MATRAGQTFVTCTSLRSFPASILERAAVYRVHAGTLRQESSAAGGEDVPRRRPRCARATMAAAEPAGAVAVE
jgi:hypothetical protein